MNEVNGVVDTYFAVWNEPDVLRRESLIEQAWSRDAKYVDPLLEAEGHEAISQMVAGVQERFPGHEFRRTSGIDAHHDQLRFAWELGAPDGSVVVAGLDIATVAADGRLSSVTGFFGGLPQGVAA